MKLFSEYRNLSRNNYILFCGRIINSLGSMIYPMLTLILSQKLGMTASMIALVIVIVSALAIPMNLIGGRLADKYEKKNILIGCNAFAIVCFLICAVIPLSFYSIAVFGTASVVLQMENPSYSALVADITPSQDRERAYSLNYLGMNLGMVLSPTIAGFLFKDFLWLMFLINAVSLLASTCLIYFGLYPVKSEEMTSEYETAEDGASVFSVLKQNKLLILFIAIAALDAAVYNQYGYLLPLDLGRVHGDTGAVIYGTLSSLNCIVVVIFTPLITKFFRRISDCGKLICADVMMTGSYILFQVLMGYIPSYYLIMTIFTWGEIFRTLASDPYMTRRIPGSHRGRIISFSLVASSLSYAAAELISGQLYDKVGSSGAWAAVISCGIVTIILELILLKKDKQVYPKLYEHRVDEKASI